MTFEKINEDLIAGRISPADVFKMLSSKDKMKIIRFYIHLYDTRKEPLSNSQLVELKAIVSILQILYNAGVTNLISDNEYDVLQEMLVDVGVPRLSGSVEINDDRKASHRFTTLRGTLDKIYYLRPDEPKTNKSRRSLDEWINSAELDYYRKTGKVINLNDETVMVTAKFDGSSAVLEWDGKNAVWLTRGDTARNLASDVTHILKPFNSEYCTEPCGVKFEVMMSEENKEIINSLIQKPYHNSRQIVTSILNSNEPDFKLDYITLVPLRLIHPGEEVEVIDPRHIKMFPTITCKLSERDKIKEFANANRLVSYKGQHLRSDGAVITILNPEIQRVLGRDNNINNFEVAYKFTEESTYTKVRKVEFYVSEFGYITPVLVTNNVILKGNTINHISLSNKERFDELNLYYGDTVKVLYDIIPYVTKDENCPTQKYGRPIEFTKECPSCGAPLDLNVIQVQCKNPECPSRVVGRIMNYCNGVKISNVGYSTLEILYTLGFLEHGIRDLYKLKKKSSEIQNIDGFGQLRTKKIINEIESKRKLNDYTFFGSISIEGINTKAFQLIFNKIDLDNFLNMIRLKNFDLLREQLKQINGIGSIKAETIIAYFKKAENRDELSKLFREVDLIHTFGQNGNKGRIVFSGCRPTDEIQKLLEDSGFEPSATWSNNAAVLIIPDISYSSSKVSKAKSKGIKVVPLGDNPIKVIKDIIGGKI